MGVHGLATPRRREPRHPKRRLFTLEHANSTLPLVQRIVADIVAQHKKVSALEKKCHVPQSGLGGKQLHALQRTYEVELTRLAELVDELADVGCLLKDSQRGLVDFRMLHQGREIELCWRLGEKKIDYWHDVGVGFPGRRPIDEDFPAELVPADAAP